MVPKKGLEPPHPCEYVDLNHARLPIPPLRHGTSSSAVFAEPAASLSLAKAGCRVKFPRHCRGAISAGCFDAPGKHFDGFLQPVLPRFFLPGFADPAAIF